MSKSNKIFNSVPVTIPDRSGFDLSHEILTTAKVGTVVPVTHFEVLPGDTISMGSMMKVSLPPFAVPFIGRIDAELTAAFIPYRLLWKGWQPFITANNGVSAATTSGSNFVPKSVPVINAGMQIGSNGTGEQIALYNRYFGPGSLMDYLGYHRSRGKMEGSYGHSSGHNYISAMPFLAYHKFCDDWIRDENIIKPFFPKVIRDLPTYNSQGAGSPGTCRALPSTVNGGMGYFDYNSPFIISKEFYDTGYLERELSGDFVTDPLRETVDQTIALGDLRQRCWSKDYFTTALNRPQAGAESSVLFESTIKWPDSVSGDERDVNNIESINGGFTVAQLRSANALQRWLERNNIAGTEYGSQILAHFGVTPPDNALQRSVLLGSVRTPVVVNNVENSSNAEAASTRNPYGSVLGSAAGFGSSFDKGQLIDNFSPKEHGVIMVFFTLIPHAYYDSGFDRELLHKTIGDFPWPEFAHIGDQPVFTEELSSHHFGTFGYQQRYVESKFKLDRVSGLLHEGENMSVYALQRSFAPGEGMPQLGKQFLEIPTDYLDQVSAVDSSISGFGCILDAYFDCKAIRVLPEYSLPSL